MVRSWPGAGDPPAGAASESAGARRGAEGGTAEATVAFNDGNPLYRVRWGLLFLERFNASEAGNLFNEALEIDKEYDDAMAYMNLLIRYRADLLDTDGGDRVFQFFPFAEMKLRSSRGRRQVRSHPR